MGLAQFVAFHEVPERAAAELRPLSFAVMIARSPGGVVLVESRYRKVWELPGGLIDAGESPRQAAVRELAEESGCVAREVASLGIVEVHDGRTHFGAVFRCEVDAVPAQFSNEETIAIGYWTHEHAPRPLGHSDDALLRRFG